MIIVIVCAVVLAIGVCLLVWGSWGWEAIGIISALTGGLGLLLCVSTIPLNRMAWQSTFVEVEAIRTSRASDDPVEGAAWRMKAAEVNAHLASGRYYNGTVFDIWIPDQVESIAPIE